MNIVKSMRKAREERGFVATTRGATGTTRGATTTRTRTWATTSEALSPLVTLVPACAIMRQRDLFPLPPSIGAASNSDREGLLSRSVQRRLHRRQHRDEMCAEAVDALNLFAGAGEYNPRANSHPAASHARIREFIHDAVRQLGPPPDGQTPAGALSELCGCSVYDDPGSQVASYNFARFSLPELGAAPAELSELYGDGGVEFIEDFNSKSFLRSEEAGDPLGRAPPVPYHDEVLRASRSEYARFLRRLLAAGMIEFDSDVCEQVGFFFVTKKYGKLRLVIDARRSNCWFRLPAHVDLCTRSSFSGLELEQGQDLYFGHFDIYDALYHFSLPAELRRYFGCPPVLAGDVGITSLGGLPVRLDFVLTPRLRILPTGWSHALWFCQTLHLKLLSRVPGFTDDRFLLDRRSQPSFSPWGFTVYVDNCIIMGHDPVAVAAAEEEGRAAIEAAGLPTHEVERGDIPPPSSSVGR